MDSIIFLLWQECVSVGCPVAANCVNICYMAGENDRSRWHRRLSALLYNMHITAISGPRDVSAVECLSLIMRNISQHDGY